MKEILKEKRYDILFLIIVSFFPIYKNALSSISIILFSLVTVGTFIYLKRKIVKENYKYILILSGFYLYSIISLLYTSDIKEGVKELQTSVPILLFPIILLLFGGNIAKKHFKYISLSYLTACTIQGIYIISQFYKYNLFRSISEAQFYNLPFRNLIFKLDYMKFHPSYLSLWFLFAVIIALHFLYKNFKSLKFYHILLLLISVGVLTFVSVASSAKISIIAFLLAMLYFLFSLLKSWKIKFVSIVVFIGLAITGIYKIPFLKSRFIDEIKATKFEPPVGDFHNSVNIRFGIMNCATAVFSNNWLFGVGIGDAQKELNNCYTKFDTNVYTDSTYNTHNNYFHYAVITGIFGLLLFIIALIFQYRLAFSNHNVLFACFLIMVSVSFFVENVLVRNHGVVFYAFFSTLFIKLIQNEGKI
ncbi:O-antigen ligase family protein [Aureivirga marina]|uniref:O-antigen ligase family protein n=1 Tax=Aureivirga marina TaxID=1182451 RepID=UPI0018C9163D|nr:O-antigen ligase family protein [Aureivirga marina]